MSNDHKRHAHTAHAHPAAQAIETKEAKRSPFLLLACVLIVILAAGIYLNVVRGAFILDDNLLIKDNAYVKTWAYVPMFFMRGIGEVVGATSTYYRPLQVLAYTILYHFWKLNTIPYHILNIFFHVLLGLSVFWMVQVLFKDRVLALFTTMIYIVHPAHVESVAYISGLGDCMVGFATVLTFALYVKNAQTRGAGAAGWYLLTILAYIFTLFIKENGIILPGLVILYHLAFRKRPKIVPLLTVLAITAVYLVFRASLQKTGEANLTILSVLQRVPGFFVALSIYARILPFPFDLFMGHENTIFAFRHPLSLIGCGIFIALIGVALWAWRRHPLVTFGIGWFFISIAPVSNLYPIAFYMADHYLYIPSIGLFLIVGQGLRLLYNNNTLKFVAVAIVAAITAYFSYLTVIQNWYWKDPVFFYKRTLAYAPYSARMYSNLAKEYGLEANTDKAIELYKVAVKVDPMHTVAWYNLGVSYFRLGKYDEAIAYCKKAIETDPKYAHAYNIIGAAYLTQEKYDDAIDSFQKALAIYQNHVDTMLNLATAYYKKGRKDDSIAILKMIIEKNPEYATAYSNLGYVYSETGRDSEAVELYKKALSLNPRYVDAYNNLAFSYYKKGDKQAALEMYRKVLSIEPENAKARDNIPLIEKELKK